jgi:steroid 5-alpha reductase family enzyme
MILADDFLRLWASSALFVTVAMLGVWLLSLRLRDASIVDIFWGAGFAGISLVGLAFGAGDIERRALVATMTLLWGLRLAAHLFVRNRGEGEDGRYQAMRRRHGDRFGIVSLRTVFAFQGVLMLVVALPVVVAQSTIGSPIGALDVAGIALFACGLAFEAIGDVQLTRFKADPANAGLVMDRGLWAWTRHPNYFGDFLVWWAIFATAAGSALPWPLVAAVGPAVMAFLLMRVSGVPILERRMQRSRPGYAEYAKRTSSFFPRPPRST